MFSISIKDLTVTVGPAPCAKVVNVDQFAAFVKGIVKMIIDEMASRVEQKEKAGEEAPAESAENTEDTEHSMQEQQSYHTLTFGEDE